MGWSIVLGVVCILIGLFVFLGPQWFCSFHDHGRGVCFAAAGIAVESGAHFPLLQAGPFQEGL